MYEIGSSTHAAASRMSSPAYLFQRGGLNRSSRSSSESRVEGDDSSTQPANVGSTVLWLALGAFFFALVFGYPLLLSVLGDSHGFRYLLRLGSSLVLLTFLGLFVGVVHWLTKR